jgi:protein SCO1
MLRQRLTLILGVSLLTFNLRAAETSAPASPSSSSNSNANQQVFQVNGLVLEVIPAEKSVKIKHEEIRGYMKAMTMTFDVKDTNELAGIGPGDPVTFRMTVTDTYGWIDQIRKTGPKRNDLPTTGAVRVTRDVERLTEGDRFPDYQFTNERGHPFNTSEFRGQALAINFLFTRCPFPTFCPQTARYFAETQEALSSMSNGPTNWHLLSITIDPEHDTSDVLKRYAETYNYNPNRWTFATGPLVDITAIADQFGLTFYREEPGGLPTHTLRTVIIDAGGSVQKIVSGNDWKPEELIAEIKAAAAKRK